MVSPQGSILAGIRSPQADFAGALAGGMQFAQQREMNNQNMALAGQNMDLRQREFDVRERQAEQNISRADYEMGTQRLGVINRLAKQVKTVPESERAAFVQTLNPAMLESVGINPADIAGVPLDDRSLDGLIAQTGAVLDEVGMTEYQSQSLGLERDKLQFQRDKLNSPNAGEPSTAKEREWQRYQELQATDPESAEQFARATGFSSREGQTLSSFAEKQIDAAFTEHSAASNNVMRYQGLAQNLRKAEMSGGAPARWSEWVKEQTGNQDEITALRKEARQIANSEGIKNLPPGPATDRDIEIVMAPFPSETANPEYIANWLESMSRLNQKAAEFAEFKADFIAKNGSVRTRDGQSMIAAWKGLNSEQQSQNREPQSQPQNAPVPGQQSIDDLLRMY